MMPYGHMVAVVVNGLKTTKAICIKKELDILKYHINPN